MSELQKNRCPFVYWSSVPTFCNLDNNNENEVIERMSEMILKEYRYHIFRDFNRKNRAYVIDLCGNKVFYGTIYQCRKFVDFMNKGDAEHENGMDGKR